MRILSAGMREGSTPCHKQFQCKRAPIIGQFKIEEGSSVGAQTVNVSLAWATVWVELTFAGAED